MFTLRLSFSGKAVHWAFATAGQESFCAGHEHAFAVLGGVPADKIRYDNLKAAVSRVLFDRTRIESARWVAFRSHYGFDAFYCAPGRDGAHEKGGVEGEGGRFRRTHLVPVPKVDSLAELNARLERYNELAEAADERQLSKVIARYGRVTCSAPTSSANLARWIAAAPSCCSKYSPNARNATPSPSPATSRSATGPRPSPTAALHRDRRDMLDDAARSPRARAASGTTSRSRSRCCGRCRPSRWRPA